MRQMPCETRQGWASGLILAHSVPDLNKDEPRAGLPPSDKPGAVALWFVSRASRSPGLSTQCSGTWDSLE
jgi:hypothetical protein